MRLKQHLLDERMLLLGKIRTLRFIDKGLYPILYKKHPFLFEEEEPKKKKK